MLVNMISVVMGGSVYVVGSSIVIVVMGLRFGNMLISVLSM